MVNRSIRNFLQFVAPDHAGSTTDNTDYAAQLRLAQLESVDKQTGSMLLAHVAGAVFLGAAVLHPSNAAFLAVWLAGFFLLLLSIPARKWARRGLMRSAGNTVPVRALAFIRLQMHVAGLLWAAGAIMLFPGAASEAKILVVVAVAGAMATGALFGGGIVWLSLVAARTRNWALQRRLGKAEKRAATAEDQLAATSAGTGTDPKQPELPPSRRLS